MVKLVKLFVTLALLFPTIAYCQEGKKFISFNSVEYDFGKVLEADGRLCHSFSFVNSSKSEVTLLAPVPGCSCIDARITRNTLKPGETASVEVVFDPSGAESLVYRTVEIYAKEGGHQATLSVLADVQPIDGSLERHFPVVLSEALRADRKQIAFGYSYWGESASKSFTLANLSHTRVRVDARTSSEELELAGPSSLEPGASAVYVLTSTIPDTPGKYAFKKDWVRFAVDGKEVDEPIVVERLVLGRLGSGENAPSLMTYPSVAKLSRSFFAKEYTGSMELANPGRSDLKILDVQAGGAGCSLVRGQTVKPGEKVKVTVRTDEPQCTVEIFTNDPVRPYKELIFKNL